MTNQNESSAGGTVIEQQKEGILANGIKPSDPHELGDTNLSVLPSEEKLSIDSIKRRDVEVSEDAQAKQIISNSVDFDSALGVPTNALNKGELYVLLLLSSVELFYNPKNLDCIGVLCFLKSKNCIGALSFFKVVFTPFFMTLSFQNGINR